MLELVLVNMELVLECKVGEWARKLRELGCTGVESGSRQEELGSSAWVPESRLLAWVV